MGHLQQQLKEEARACVVQGSAGMGSSNSMQASTNSPQSTHDSALGQAAVARVKHLVRMCTIPPLLLHEHSRPCRSTMPSPDVSNPTHATSMDPAIPTFRVRFLRPWILRISKLGYAITIHEQVVFCLVERRNVGYTTAGGGEGNSGVGVGSSSCRTRHSYRSHAKSD